MKNSLDHLPKIKQDELQKIVSIIRDNCHEIEKIILFGSYARGDYKEEKDLDKFRKSGHVSDYDILVVTTTKKEALNYSLWNKIKQEDLKSCNFSADPRITTHDIDVLNIKLAEGQYFFSDIKKEGVMLYDNKKKQLAKKRQLTQREQKRLAQDNFDEWFKSASSFYKGYEFYLTEKDNKRAAFSLHQSAEHALKAITLVFTNYCPNEHYLGLIQRSIEKFYPKINDFFKREEKEDKRRVLLLEYAYIGGRYDNDFYISEEDLKILEKDVEKLLEITQEICEIEIKEKLLAY